MQPSHPQIQSHEQAFMELPRLAVTRLGKVRFKDVRVAALSQRPLMIAVLNVPALL